MAWNSVLSLRRFLLNLQVVDNTTGLSIHRAVLPAKESLTVEFKSDIREQLSDDRLVQAVVCMANTEGGEIWLGVEDDGTPTGLNPGRQNTATLAVMIANCTIPNLSVDLHKEKVNDATVARIRVPKSQQIVATTSGKYLRRKLKADGTPECTPMLPHDIAQRQVTFSQIDPTAQSVPGATLADLLPLERDRLRRTIARNQGDHSLLELDDAELDGALGLTRLQGDDRVPTLAGLLMIGKEERLRDLVPSHEVAFQVLSGTDVRTNEFFRGPLLGVVERINQRFEALLAAAGQEELADGLFQIPVPKYDPAMFREALINAITHRDYSRLGSVHIRFDDIGLTISNPGGFPEGVTLENLLTVDPHPRNPRLADIMKRLGLAERTGRGVDRIFAGMLRFGRPVPDYSHSSGTDVKVIMAHGNHDATFMRMILHEEDRQGRKLPPESLLVLLRLNTSGRVSANELWSMPMLAQFRNRRVLENLVESGLVSTYGSGKGRTYSLSAKVYASSGRGAEFVRAAGTTQIQNEQMILSFVEKYGSIKRSDVVDMCRLSLSQASLALKKLVESKQLIPEGSRRWTVYKKPQ